MDDLAVEVDSDEESEDDDDYMDNEDEEHGEAQDASCREGPMMLKDWDNGGEWASCFCILKREIISVYASEGDDEHQDLDLLDTCGVNSMTSIQLGDDGILTIQFEETTRKKPLVLCGPGMNIWRDCLKEAMKLYGKGSLIKKWVAAQETLTWCKWRRHLEAWWWSQGAVCKIICTRVALLSQRQVRRGRFRELGTCNL